MDLRPTTHWLLLLLLLMLTVLTAATFVAPTKFVRSRFQDFFAPQSLPTTSPHDPSHDPPQQQQQAPREGIARFDALYAERLRASVHAPLKADARLAALLPLPPDASRVAFLGVPAAAFSGAERTVVFEPRPHLAPPNGATTVLAEWPLRQRQLPEGSQHRIEVSSPLFLAQLDRADRMRALRCCARWMHPSQGVLVLRFLDGGAATAKWCNAHIGNQMAAVYSCWARLGGRVGGGVNAAADEAVVYLTERARPTTSSSKDGALIPLRDDPATTTYESLVFAAAADGGWAEAVRRAGLKVELELRADDGDVVTWVCRKRRE